MEVSIEKSKIMTNNTNDISADISINSQKVREVTSFNYLGATLCKDGICSVEICIRIASAMTTMARLNRMRRSGAIKFCFCFCTLSYCHLHRLLRLRHGPCLLTLTTGSRLSCPDQAEAWTQLANADERIHAFVSRSSLRKLLSVSYSEHKTSEWVQSKINLLVGPQKPLPATEERETRMVLTYYASLKALQNHSSGHLGRGRQCNGG